MATWGRANRVRSEAWNARTFGIPSWTSWAILLTGSIACASLSVILGQDANWDLRNYHYYNAYAYLNKRIGFDYGVAQIQTYLNPTLDIPFFLLINTLRPMWVGFVIGTLHGLNLWLTFLIANCITASWDSVRKLPFLLACAAAGMYGPGAVSELGTQFHDLTLTAPVLASLLLLLRHAALIERSAEHHVPASAIVASGLFLGTATGLKYTNGIYIPGGAIAVLLLAARSHTSVQTLAKWMFSVLVAMAVGAGHWMYELWRHFGTPFGAFFNGIFRSPYFEPTTFVNTRFFPTTVLQTLFYPFYFCCQGPFFQARDIRFVLIYSLFVILVLAWLARLGRSTRSCRYAVIGPIPLTYYMLMVFFVGSYVVWQTLFSIYRYAIALELLGPVLVYVLLSRLIARLDTRLIASVALFILIGITMKAPDWGRTQWRETFFGTLPPAIPDPSRSIVIMTSLEPLAYVVPAFPPAVRFVRIHSNFFGPESTTRMAMEIRSLVRAHQGPLFLLSHSVAIADSAGHLAAYGLRLRSQSCVRLRNHLDDGIVFCEVERQEVLSFSADAWRRDSHSARGA